MDSRLLGRVWSRWGLIAIVVLVVLAAALVKLISQGDDAPRLVVDASDSDCSAMAIYDPNLSLSNNSATTSDIHDSPMTVVANQRRLAQEDVHVWTGEAASAASTSERQQAEAHRLQAQAQLDLFDAILAGDAQRTDGPGKVGFSTDSPEAWLEIIEDSGYWYATGLNLTGLPPAACP